MKYDIFISYRRVGGAQYARILQLMLSQRGYKVFLDYDELKDGVFGKRIKAAIAEAPIFLLLLSKDALDRCENVDDWLREEVQLALKLKKKIVPINPDKTFDGIHTIIPKEIVEIASDIQHSEIDFGQALGVTVDLMINNRLTSVLGVRHDEKHKDRDYEEAKFTLQKIDERNRFLKRLAVIVAIVVVGLVVTTCVVMGYRQCAREKIEVEKRVLNEMRTELEKKYADFHLVLSPNLTKTQMAAIDTLLINMKEVRKDSLWLNKYELTVGLWHGVLNETYDVKLKDMPMTQVTYGEIYSIFLDSLRMMTSIAFELPSVEDWQYAARGGAYNETSCYVGADDVNTVAWYKDNSGGRAHQSNGQQGKLPNMLDLFDMSGNVSELCNSPYVGVSDKWTICGGNYLSPAAEVTTFSKAPFGLNERSKTVGFRLSIKR